MRDNNFCQVEVKKKNVSFSHWTHASDKDNEEEEDRILIIKKDILLSIWRSECINPICFPETFSKVNCSESLAFLLFSAGAPLFPG